MSIQIVSDRIGVYSRQSVEQQQFQYFMRLKAFQSALLESSTHSLPMTVVFMLWLWNSGQF